MDIIGNIVSAVYHLRWVFAAFIALCMIGVACLSALGDTDADA